VREVNDYCLCDALDTYFVFLRTRVMACEITNEQEAEIAGRAEELLRERATEFPVLERYLSG
jgi:3'-5' exonuclease